MLPFAEFGRTGHRSSRVIFGAAALGGMSESRAIKTLDLVASFGVNHIDTAAMYGSSEDHLKPWLADHRSEVFLATKTEERVGSVARAALERSLQRMGVDHIDLIQLHNLVEPDEWATAFNKGGAVEALNQARAEGLVSFIGVTGHGLRIPSMHLRSLAEFDFDAVLFPFNHSLLSIDQYRDDVTALRDLCRARNTATQTIKAVARRRWEDGTSGHRSWYEPLTDTDAIQRAVRYVLSQPDLFLNTTSDATLLPLIFEAAQGELARPLDEEMNRDTAEFGVTPLFDGAALDRI
ncbi:MAG: aldo/keto reductase [Actinomycetota bacterium]|nr:aldo/keto reductase [Actinomycetota bacterium]MDA3020653.1 aldo/keto reductase [Actinomycetota bacterium]